MTQPQSFKYGYDTFIDDLEIGHEFHFMYREKEYSISHSAFKTYLTKHGDPDNALEFDDQMEILNGPMIDGKTMKELWPEIRMITIF